MQVCYDDQAVARSGGIRRARARRPLPRGRDRDRRRRALRRARDLRRGGHGARRGGRNPLRRLVLRAAGAVARPRRLRPRSRTIVRRLAPALGVVGLVNVQLAVVDGEVFVIEANPRASRTVPFASKATGINLVEAACRLAAGTPPRRARPPGRSDAEAGFRESRGAAVRALPGRRPRARPGDALDRRGDGERGRFSDRLREGRARGRAAAARRRDGLPLGARRGQAGGGRGRRLALEARVPPRRDRRARPMRSRPPGSPSSTCAR